MTTDAMLTVVRNFLALATEGEAPSDRELARALDRLALAHHDTPPGLWADDDSEPPPIDHEATYKALSERFPEFGYYASADASAPLSEPMTGDAINDLADIVDELSEAVWRAETLGVDDAHAHLHSLYFHSGAHMRHLSLYLHAKQFG